MTVTCGFFNSINHDRRYNAEEMSAIFDGIILDGVFNGVGEGLSVLTTEDKKKITVGSGRAWFDHTWTLNDVRTAFEITPNRSLNERIDTVVIDVDHRDQVRKNQIMIVVGIASADPQPPLLLDEDLHKQHPIANFRMRQMANTVEQADIENLIGTEKCPWVTGPLEAIDITDFVAQWKAQFEEKLLEWMEINDERYEKWEEAKDELWKDFFGDTVTQKAEWEEFSYQAKLDENERIVREKARQDQEAERQQHENERQESYSQHLSDVAEGKYNGATFTPSISPEGMLSWTNDKQLPNPPDYLVKGEKGDPGICTDVGALFSLGVEDDGWLYCYYSDDATDPPEFDYEDETGILYYITEGA